MQVSNAVFIRAPLDHIYTLAAQVERWPALLPHYRWVRIVEANGSQRRVEMACWRDVIPLRWTALQDLEPDVPRIRFEHVAGVTRGMAVAWVFRQIGDGVQVRIEHELTLGWPIVGRAVAERIIGPYFVQNVAGKTLARIKELAEGKVVQA